ncbi:glycosyltransferase [Streptomyces sp. NPDC014806]|uniref:glycosyltransferase n=1 Tax=Streptomyces sp. NPDC014806 TaxID=3364920 RepID=UPI0036F57825
MTALEDLARADILFLNWRDPTHPKAGGAEAYCYEIARRFSAAGAHVTVLTARHPGATPFTEYEGMRILRGGGTYGVYAAAAWHMLRHRHAYDAVIDLQNGIPFFSPLFTPRWTADVCVVHHVHQQQFDLLMPRPLSLLGRVLEKHVSRLVYRGRPMIVVSPSTLQGLRRELGFRNPVHIVPNGNATGPDRSGHREAAEGTATAGPTGSGPGEAADRAADRTPRIAVVSRLVPQKRLDRLVRAMPELARTVPGVHLDIAGEGSELTHLRDLARRLGVADAVTFHGHVSDARKQRLLARAWLTVVPSVAEGWGLTVIEANAVGTPALVHDVPGLRDAVLDGRTGWRLPPDADLAAGVAAALRELRDPATRERMATRCRAWAETFSWDDSAQRLAAVVLEEIWRTRRHRRSRRRSSDLAVIGRFRSTNGNETEKLMRRALRLTDAWARHGDTFHVLLKGCDEMRAQRVLRRLGVHPTALTLASHRDVLVGTGEDTDQDDPQTGDTPPGEPDAAPRPGEPQATPPHGEDHDTPARGEPQATPSPGEPQSMPVRGEPQATPSRGGPHTGGPHTAPGVGEPLATPPPGELHPAPPPAAPPRGTPHAAPAPGAPAAPAAAHPSTGGATSRQSGQAPA